jgi:AraC family transcriptional regulator of adaptative response/methylated-DNA-[protein]-cysteine methyltransferase
LIKKTSGFSISIGTYPSVFGKVMIAAVSGEICAIAFLGKRKEKDAVRELRSRWPQTSIVRNKAVASVLGEKIFTEPHRLKKLGLRVLLKGTPFQVKVWKALLTIPLGKTASYSDIAKKVGKPKATRAVGTAVGENPFFYLIPCHRVIKKSGELGDYRWGSALKKTILDWESKNSE